MMDFDRSTNKFLDELMKCREADVFIGTAKVLGVQLMTEEKDEEDHRIPRAFEDIFVDVVCAFAAAPRKRRRDLFKILKEANKTQGGE